MYSFRKRKIKQSKPQFRFLKVEKNLITCKSKSCLDQELSQATLSRGTVQEKTPYLNEQKQSKTTILCITRNLESK